MPSPAPSARVSPHQKTKFIKYYARTGNGAQSIRDAGIESACPRNLAVRLRANAGVAKRIATEIKLIDAKINVSDTSQVERWNDKASVSLGDYVDVNPDGTYKINLAKQGDNALTGISELKTTTRKHADGSESVTTSIKLADSLKPDEMLARHRGMFDADNKQKAIPIVLTRDVPGRG